MNESESGRLPDPFDRLRSNLVGLNDVVHTKPTTIVVEGVLGLGVSTFIVQTFRQDEIGDTVFIQAISAQGTQRIYLPPRITAVIARQRESVVGKRRSKAAKTEAQRRKAAGIKPAFLKGKGKKS